jgi:methylase of polypeptide subunit release factors
MTCRVVGNSIGSLLAGVEGSFDLLCANLPYIPRASLIGLEVAENRWVHWMGTGTELITRLWINPGNIYHLVE